MIILTIIAAIGQALAFAAEKRRRALRIHRSDWWVAWLVVSIFIVGGGVACALS